MADLTDREKAILSDAVMDHRVNMFGACSCGEPYPKTMEQWGGHVVKALTEGVITIKQEAVERALRRSNDD